MKQDIMPIIMTEGPYQKLGDYKWQVATNQVEPLTRLGTCG
jgi:hypothetical protein